MFCANKTDRISVRRKFTNVKFKIMMFRRLCMLECVSCCKVRQHGLQFGSHNHVIVLTVYITLVSMQEL